MCTIMCTITHSVYSCLLGESVHFSIYTTKINIKKFYLLSTQCGYVFCVDLRTNSDFLAFSLQH